MEYLRKRINKKWWFYHSRHLVNSHLLRILFAVKKKTRQENLSSILFFANRKWVQILTKWNFIILFIHTAAICMSWPKQGKSQPTTTLAKLYERYFYSFFPAVHKQKKVSLWKLMDRPIVHCSRHRDVLKLRYEKTFVM